MQKQYISISDQKNSTYMHVGYSNTNRDIMETFMYEYNEQDYVSPSVATPNGSDSSDLVFNTGMIFTGDSNVYKQYDSLESIPPEEKSPRYLYVIGPDSHGEYSAFVYNPSEDIFIPVSVSCDVSGKADKVIGAVSGHLASLDASGNLTDSGKSANDFVLLASYITNYDIDQIMNII